MRLGFIGAGKMGSALIKGILTAKHCEPADVQVYDTYAPAMEACARTWKVTAVTSALELLEGSEVVFLCVKPQDVESTLSALSAFPEERLLISIAAGISLAQLENWTQKRHRIVRVMPNTPALVGAGAAAFACGTRATSEDSDLVVSLLGSTGLAVPIAESQMDAVTGVSGSGPAYVFTFIEALADGGVLEGLPKPLALQLATQTVLGAATLVQESEEHPGVLRDQVTSPGGTTIAALAELERSGLRSALIEAVRAAARRSRELGDGK